MGRKKLGEVAAVGSTDCFCFLCCLRSVAVIFLEMILDILVFLCVFRNIQKEGKIYIIFIDVFLHIHIHVYMNISSKIMDRRK